MYVKHNVRRNQDINRPYCRFSKNKDCFPVLAYRLFNNLLVMVWNVDKNKFK